MASIKNPPRLGEYVTLPGRVCFQVELISCRTPAPGFALDASDRRFQLLWASAHDRILFTFNIGDFQQLAGKIPEHRGILLASQQSFTLKELINLLDHVLTETDADEWVGQVRWLSDWR